MTDSQHNLLDEALIEVELNGGSAPESMTLPAILEKLAAGDEIRSFVHLQAHQSQAWFCFLCQLAAMALARQDVGAAEDARGQWTELLLGLTDGMKEPWSLMVSDLSVPAFFQPPVPEGEWSAKWKLCGQPDDVDLLITSTNHDVKLARIDEPEPDHWVYALVSLQTMANYTAPGWYGVARKSSGYSCRPFVSIAPGLGWGERFRRDLAVLLTEREQIADRFGYNAEEGLTLTYLRPWDGTESLPLETLDPLFLEVSRRVRLEGTPGGLVARRRRSTKARVAAKELDGNVGDPWVPVDRSNAKALNVSSSGFHYRLLSALLLTGEYERSAAMRIRPEDPSDLFLIAQALARGKGKTNGLHERIVPIPRKVRSRLMEREARAELGKRAERRIEFVGTIQKKALRPALCALYQGDPTDLDFRDDRPRPWLDRLDGRVDRIFFPRLWEHAEFDDEEADLAWRREVLDLASEILEEAIQRASVPEPRRYRGWAAAERIFSGARRKLLGSKAAATKENE